jgi:ABC-type transport system involved in cytochrome c biogenesis permease component
MVELDSMAIELVLAVVSINLSSGSGASITVRLTHRSMLLPVTLLFSLHLQEYRRSWESALDDVKIDSS